MLFELRVLIATHSTIFHCKLVTPGSIKYQTALLFVRLNIALQSICNVCKVSGSSRLVVMFMHDTALQWHWLGVYSMHSPCLIDLTNEAQAMIHDEVQANFTGLKHQ